MMHTPQTTMIKSWGFHVALEIKIYLNTWNEHESIFVVPARLTCSGGHKPG